MISIIIIGVALVQWVAFAVISGFSRGPRPKRGMRTAERNLLISTAAVVLFWGMALFLVPSSKKTSIQAAASGDNRSIGSCASIEEGVSSVAVTAKLGKADEVRPDEDTRGPSATIWVYRQSRCAIHLFDDKVEFIE